MKDFENDMCEILEVDSLDLTDELRSFDAWDSLAVLSIISYCDTNYGINISADTINQCETLQNLKDVIINYRS
ncbi:acyl carrier protein [Arenibacter algicola]|uniref:Acyl carrier protein n=1 Tax=Arenibacter algicola TaxID=616991 RepID=A0A221UZ63_9FLAO|nr:acyl carrier protein [Arenibacter algicola]ASO06655.1 acyl carrier protein [Arenibacter algicola]